MIYRIKSWLFIMEDEASVNRLIRKRTANRTVLKNLLNQGHGIVNNVEDKKEE